MLNKEGNKSSVNSTSYQLIIGISAVLLFLFLIRSAAVFYPDEIAERFRK